MDDSSPMVGAAGIDFNPDRAFYAKVRRLRAEYAKALVRPVTVDCVRPDVHAGSHTAPDDRGRRICGICHPMPATSGTTAGPPAGR